MPGAAPHAGTGPPAGAGGNARLRGPRASRSPPTSRLRRRAGRTFLALLASVAASGCLGFLSRPPGGGGGLPEAEEEIRRLLADGRSPAALERLREGEGDPGDGLLAELYRGLVAYYAGEWEASGRSLDLAAWLAEERVTKSLSREALSLLTSDRVRPFVPGETEGLLLHYYGALAWLRTGERDEAAVEARRLGRVLERLADDDPPSPEEARTRAFFHRFAAAIFEVAGESEDAGVARRREAALLGEDAPEAIGAEGVPPGRGEVLVLVEAGFAPHRVESSLGVALFPGEVDALDSGSLDERLAVAGCVSARLLGAGPDPRTGGVGLADRSRGRRHRRISTGRRVVPCVSGYGGRWSRGTDDGPYLLRVAWPELRSSPLPVREAAVVDGEGTRFPPRATLDVDAATRRDFAEGRGELLTRTLLRGVAKFALTRAVEEKVGEKDEAGGKIAGAVVNLGTALMERADTRSWHLVPGRVFLYRVPVPPGRHALVLEIGGPGEDRPRRVELDPVHVAPGEIGVVTARIWR